MRIRRCPCWLLTALLIAVFGPWGQTLHAQESIPQSILQAQKELTNDEMSTVNSYLDTQVDRLESNDPATVALGRTRILDPIPLSNSQYFLDYYRQQLAQRVLPLIRPDESLMTRLNVAIISAKLTGDDLVKVFQTGANDESSAVRYWIAKAVASAAKDGAFNAAQQQAVLAVLALRLKTEDSSLVLEQVMLAIASIDLPEAIQTILEGLDSRVDFHLNNPNDRFKPVYNGLQQLWSKLIALRTNNKNVDKEQMELARIAFRYYVLITDQLDTLQETGANEDVTILKQDKAQMALLCGRVMADVAREKDVNPPQAVDTTKPVELKVSRDRWHDILKTTPFNFTDDQLTVQATQPAN